MRAMNQQHEQVMGEVKLRYKMYKAGKMWLFAGVGIASALVVFGSQNVAASTDANADAAIATTQRADKQVTTAAVAGGDAANTEDDTAKTPANAATTESAAVPSTAEPDAEQQRQAKEQQPRGAQTATTVTEAAQGAQQSADNQAGTAISASEDAVAGNIAPDDAKLSTENATPDDTATSHTSGDTPAPAREQAKTDSVAQSAADDSPAQAKAQVDATSTTITLQREQATIKSGETASFDLKLNVSGITSDGGEQQLVVDLPTNFAPTNTDLSINGVRPRHDQGKQQLIYTFATPQNGLTVSKQFNFATTSGDIVDGTPLTMAARFIDGEQVTESGGQTVTISSKAIYGVAVQFVGVLPTDAAGNLQPDASGNVSIDQSKITGRAGDVVAYSVGVSTPKQLAGQAYIEPGTRVQVRVVLPVGMSYLQVDSSTPQPVVNKTTAGQTVLDFYLPAPSIAEQDAAVQNLLSAQLNIVGRIDSDVPYNSDLTVAALMGATSINGDQVQSATATSVIKTVPDFSKIGHPTYGSEFYIYAWGPKDGAGGIASPQTNTDPEVYPSATLSYLLQLGPADNDSPQGETAPSLFDNNPELKLTKDGYVRQIQSYIATYDIDDHLNVKTLSVGAPYATLNGNTYALDEAPKFSLYVKYQDATDFESTPVLSDITDTAGQQVDLRTLLDNSRGVDELKFVWTTPVAGQTYDNIRFTMTPKAGYYGTVKNTLAVNIAGWDWLGWMETRYDQSGAYTVGTVPGYTAGSGRVGLEVHLTDEVGNPIERGSAGDHTADYNQYLIDKTAEIVKPAANTPRVLNESIQFAKVTNGKIDPGANQLRIVVDNNKASLQAFSDLTTYVVLPEGVSYIGSDAQVHAQTVAGKTLLTIDWRQKALAPNSSNRLDLAITVAEQLNLNNLQFGLYSTVGEADTVVPRTVNPSDASDVQILDGADLLGLQLLQKVYALQITAAVNSDSGHQVMTSAAARNSAGDTGSLVTVRANEDGQFLLNLVNTTDQALQNFSLVATLPQDADTAVLDQTVRGSNTNGVQLSGPIQLPSSWQGKANVRYVTAAAPEGMAATAVSDFSKVTGFTISFTDPLAYLDGGTQQIIVPVHLAANATVGAQAYISFAVGANGLTQAEGLKAGIVVVARQQANATVTYHDATNGQDLAVITAATDATLSGDIGSTSAYDSATTIATYLKQGYQLVTDGTKDDTGASAIVFSTAGVTTNYIVTLKHAYTADTARIVTRTIHYLDRNGKTLAPDKLDSQTFVTVTDRVTQENLSYTAAGSQQTPALTDGVPNATGWQVATTATFAAVTNPAVSNYHVVATTANPADLTDVGASVIRADSADQVVTVTYAPNVGEVVPPVTSGQLTVRYVDEQGKALLPQLAKTGNVGNAYAVSAPQIRDYRLLNAAQVNGNFTIAPQTISFVYRRVSRPDERPQQGTLTVHYVDDAGQVLLAATTQTGIAGSNYHVTAPAISAYSLRGAASVSGVFTNGAQNLTFVYRHNVPQTGANEEASLTIHYQTATGQAVRQDTIVRAFVGNTYALTPPVISGYTYSGLGSGSAALQGQLTAATTLVLIYQQNGGGVDQPDRPSQPDEPDQPGRHELPSTGGEVARPGTPRVTQIPATKTGLPASGGVQTVRKTKTTTPVTAQRANGQRSLPQTGDSSSSLLALLGLGLMSLLSGAWFWKRMR